MNRVNPILAAALAPFAPPSVPTVHVPVAKCDVEHLRDGFLSSDPEGWVTLKPTDDEMIKAVHRLIERHAVELDAIVESIITEKKA